MTWLIRYLQHPPWLNTLLLFVMLLGSVPALARAATAEATDAAAPTASATLAPTVYPGLEEVTPRATALAAQVIAAEQQILMAEQALELQPQIDALAKTLDGLETQFNIWEQIGDWPLSSLMEARSRYAELQRQQIELQQQLSAPLKILEALHQTWIDEKAFWEGWGQTLRETWQTSLKDARIKAPRETFERALETIHSVIGRTTRATNDLVRMQQGFATQQERVAGRLTSIEGAASILRREAFRRNAPSLFSPDFYTQFTPELLVGLQKNLETILRFPADFLRSQGWIAIVQLLTAAAIGLQLELRRRRPKPITMELRFLFSHPWAGSLFIALATISPLYTNAPPLWSWLLMVISFTAATLLIVAIYKQITIRRLIRLIAFVFILSETMQLFGLPRPLYQVYLVILCCFIVIFCLSLAKRLTQDREATHSGLTMVLYLGAIVGLLGLGGQLIGFATFTANLIDALIGSIMVVLGSNMARRLADGAVIALMRKEWVRNQRFVKRLGISTTERLQTLLHIIIYANAAIYLLVAWSIYDAPKEAWAALMALEFSFGELSISMHLVVMLALVLYLTNLISWLLQAFVDAQVLTPRGMGFGVRAAFKRLLHYALFTIGFFVAISMTGFGLEKFAIIAGALGVGIGFGLQNIVNNFISGLILLFERPVKVGDTISLDDQWGTITKIGLRSTVVETLDRAEVIVPNADLISQKVTNWTYTNNVSRVILPVGVAYGSNLTRVLSILDVTAQEHPEILKEPAPSAIFTGFGESSIDFELRVWIDDINKRLRIRSDLGQAIDQKFREAGISIPFPQRDLHLRSVESNLQALFGHPAGEEPPKPEETAE